MRGRNVGGRFFFRGGAHPTAAAAAAARARHDRPQRGGRARCRRHVGRRRALPVHRARVGARGQEEGHHGRMVARGGQRQGCPAGGRCGRGERGGHEGRQLEGRGRGQGRAGLGVQGRHQVIPLHAATIHCRRRRRPAGRARPARAEGGDGGRGRKWRRGVDLDLPASPAAARRRRRHRRCRICRVRRVLGGQGVQGGGQDVDPAGRWVRGVVRGLFFSGRPRARARARAPSPIFFLPAAAWTTFHPRPPIKMPPGTRSGRTPRRAWRTRSAGRAEVRAAALEVDAEERPGAAVAAPAPSADSVGDIRVHHRWVGRREAEAEAGREGEAPIVD